MAFTDQNKADAYLFFVLAFNAAPGTVYGGQIVEAYESGMTTAQIVEQYTTKEQFLKLYPATQTSAQFATSLVNTVASTLTTASVKAAAVADIEKALAAGWTKGQVITEILGNLSKKNVADADWGNTVAKVNNKVAVAQALTEGANALSTTDVALLSTPLSKVTEVQSTVQQAINGASPLGAKLETLATSKKAVADFAKALDLDADGVADGITSDKVQTTVNINVNAKADAITAPAPAPAPSLVANWAANKTAAENTALVAAQKATNDALVAANKAAVTTATNNATAPANAANAVTTAQIAQYKALAGSVKVTSDAALVAKSDLEGAAAKLATLDALAVPAGATGEITGYTKLNADNVLILDPALTDAAKKAAATAYISAFNADKTAKTSLDTATTAKNTFAVDTLGSTAAVPPATTPTPAAKENAIIGVINAETAVTNAEKLNPAIDKALANYATALSTQTALKDLTDAVSAAQKAFTDAGLALPVEASTALVATAGDDTYLVGTANGSIGGFGVLGKDGIFVGTSYTLNAAGDLTKGNDASLEVFFKANGANTDVYVEQKAFGSSTAGAAAGNADFVKITLTGVAADKLVLKDGFVTVAA